MLDRDGVNLRKIDTLSREATVKIFELPSERLYSKRKEIALCWIKCSPSRVDSFTGGWGEEGTFYKGHQSGNHKSA